jgi:hypothetical protein
MFKGEAEGWFLKGTMTKLAPNADFKVGWTV